MNNNLDDHPPTTEPISTSSYSGWGVGIVTERGVGSHTKDFVQFSTNQPNQIFPAKDARLLAKFLMMAADRVDESNKEHSDNNTTL